MRWALLALLLAVAAADEEEQEGDEAPFMVLVSDAAGARRAGVLVSARACLTCGACARGEGLRVRAAGGGEPRAVLRVFEPRGGGAALLELERPLPERAQAQPIEMASAARECGAGAACQLVRVWRRVRIVDALLQHPLACRALPAAADLCLAGSLLCEVDRGTAVVCDGRLCGVLARSARADDAAGDGDSDSDGDGEACGTLHAAHSIVGRRKFIHCAHTLRSCGRGDCAEVCTERRLLEARAPPSRVTHDVTPRRTSPNQLTSASAAPPAPQHLPSPPQPPSRESADPTVTVIAIATATATATVTANVTARTGIARPSIEWVEAPDYIEYGGDERQPPPSTTPSSTSPSPPPPPRTSPPTRPYPPPRQSPPALAAAAPAHDGPSQDSVPWKRREGYDTNLAHSTSRVPHNILSFALLLMVLNTAR